MMCLCVGWKNRQYTAYIHYSQYILIEFLDVTIKPKMIYFVLSETSVLIYIRPNLTETKLGFMMPPIT